MSKCKRKGRNTGFGAQVINRRIVASGQPAMGLRNLQVRLTHFFPTSGEVMLGFRQLIYLIIYCAFSAPPFLSFRAPREVARSIFL